MKTLLAVISAIFFFACASQAAIDGYVYKGPNAYTVPAGKIFVIQQVSYNTSETAANHYILVNGVNVWFPSATNGLYTLSKALFLPAGATLNTANSSCVVFGVIIDASDAPLFVGGGSSLGNVTFANNTLTGELQLSSTAATKVIIQSSTNLVNWRYDSSVVLGPGTDKTKVSFAVPISSPDHFYRGLVRRINAG
jgi:hypothetical protein